MKSREREEQLELYRKIKAMIKGETYDDPVIYRSYSKIRLHLDQMIRHLDEVETT